MNVTLRLGDEDVYEDAYEVQQEPLGTRPSIDRVPCLRRSEAALVPAASCDPVKSIGCKRQLASESEPRKQTAKRARTGNRAARKHERFWLADGNAIIELDGVRFRVHQSWLARHSEHLASILLETGHDDKPEDRIIEFERSKLRLILNAVDFEALLLLYENPGNYRNTIEPPVLMSLIRATTLLGFDSDRVWLVKELEVLWPSDLEELVANPEPHLDAPEVAVLAWMYNIDRSLKPAFYDMARMPGFGLENLEKSKQISRADILRFTRMREYLSDMWVQAATRESPAFVCQNFRGAPSSDGEGTSTPNQAEEKPALDSDTSASVASTCLWVTARREAWVRLVYDSGIFTQYRYDPLRGLAALINIEWTDDWCKDCQEKRKADWHIMQRSIWEKVGEYLRED
ncbi:hypothetical protein DFJ58DRAFT_789450 [Suillus subalutaceus]|uniref:uncharacterized protein n=1 Tax=Suillus subalutaceus TaxID=48586 RepID=UPI001B86DC8B|nr:uncharacterized protein DFJ58DRAFT_789450 [Suillus subalutaceus]KAG1853422.1 hypothetical protein DFJ58DRAFT_789450 [Suillus subalutaceus]